MRVVVVVGPDRSGRWQDVDDDGAPLGPPVAHDDLAGAMAARDGVESPRWVWPATTTAYPPLLRAGVTVARCHDLTLVEGLLLAAEDRAGEPRTLPAAVARVQGLPVPEDVAPRVRDTQPALFEPEPAALPGGLDPLAATVAVHAGQQRRLAALTYPERLRVLAAAESAGGLAAAEMGHHGLPWRADVHAALLVDLLGDRPAADGRPARLAELAARIGDELGTAVDPDRPASVLSAFHRAGIELATTRAAELRTIDHPAVAPLLVYKELARLHVAHGWSWLASWVDGGRFRPEYVVGGVVSGRWATRGGAALQLPRIIRRAVVADPGWTLVVADAAQLEPRVLAALSGDPTLAAVAAAGDLYDALAAEAFDGDRDRAKVGLLSVMYGGTGGEAALLTAILRRRFPVAIGYVEAAAAAGERGELVRSRLGRTSPRPAWGDGDETDARRATREWGRFTRNFVVQASAADWALVFLAELRRRLPGDARLVFFQHDEVIVHCPADLAADVEAAVLDAGVAAGRLVFGDTPVRFPLSIAAVDCYADAK